MEAALWGIFVILSLLVVCQDTSWKKELQKIREQLEKIAKKMEE